MSKRVNELLLSVDMDFFDLLEGRFYTNWDWKAEKMPDRQWGSGAWYTGDKCGQTEEGADDWAYRRN